MVDVFIKYAWVKTLKDKNHKTVPNSFIDIANESNRKLNRLWIDQGTFFFFFKYFDLLYT